MRKFTYFYSLLLTALFLLPWSGMKAEQLNEGFEGTAFPPDGWTTIHVSGNKSWERYTSSYSNYGHGSKSCAQIMYVSGGHENYLVTPQLKPQTGEKLTFYTKQNYNGSTTVTVEVSTTTNEASAFTKTLFTYVDAGATTSTWAEQVIDLADYVDQNIYLAFHAVDNYGFTFYLDDVSGVTLKPESCPKTGTPAATAKTTTTATIEWTENGSATAWNLQYKKSSESSWSASIPVETTPSHELTGLTPGTTYDIRVQANCGDEQSDWKDGTSFDTECGTATLPFEPTFANGVKPNCWTIADAAWGSGWASKWYTYLVSGTNYGLQYQASSSSTEATVQTPSINLSSDAELTFSYTNYNSGRKVPAKVIISDGTTSKTVTLANTESATLVKDTIDLADVDGANFIGKEVTITFIGTKHGSSSGTGYLKIANIKVAAKSCAVPTGLAATATADGAVVTWNSSADEWALQYRINGEGAWTEVANLTEKSHTLTGLTSGKTYEVQVKTACSSTLSSAWTASQTFTPSSCPIVTDAWLSEGTYESVKVSCTLSIDNKTWDLQKKVDDEEWGNIATEIAEAYKEVAVEVGHTYAFRVKPTCGSDWFNAGSFEPEYPTPGTPSVTAAEKSASVTWTAAEGADGYEYVLMAGDAAANWEGAQDAESPLALSTLTDGTNYTVYVRAKYGEGRSAATSKNFTTATIAPSFTDAAASISGTTATVALNAYESSATQLQYVVMNGTAAANWTSATLVAKTTTSIEVPGLTVGNSYTLYVRAYYSATLQSDADSKFFEIACVAETLPFNYGFEDASLSGCWKTLRTNANYDLPAISSADKHGESGQSLRFYGSTSQKAVVVLPQFEASIDQLILSFYYKNASTASTRPQFKVGYVTNPDNASSFVEKKSLTRETAWTATGDIDFSKFENIPAGAYMAIAYTGGSNDAAGYVDDIEVKAVPSCEAPTDLKVMTVGATSARFFWTSTETSWKLQYKAEGDADWSEVSVNTNPFDLTGLTIATNYQAKIQSACGSAFTDAVEFTTWCNLDDAANLPLEEDFTAGTKPACFEFLSTTEYPQITSNKIWFQGTNKQIVVLPSFDIELNKLSLKFDFSVNYAVFEFGYFTTDGSEFQSLGIATESGKEIDLSTTSAPDAAGYLAIRYNYASSPYASGSVDNIRVRKTPTCLKPTNLDATPSVGSLNISWTAGTETAWNLQYKTGSADWTTVPVTENPYLLSGLEQGVSYTVHVQADCGGEQSDWSDEAQFTTKCATIDALPFIADFSQALSNCWKTYAATSYNIYISNEELKATAPKTTGNESVVVLPAFDAALNTLGVSFDYKGSNGTIEVGYVTDAADKTTFVAVGEAFTVASAYKLAVTPLASVNEAGNIAIRFKGNTGDGDFTIDNLRVATTLALADNTDNTATLSANLGKTLDVVIGRTFVCADYYNTICLPFSLSAAELAASPIASDDLWAFKYAKVEGGELLIRIQEADHINAGEPYLIAWPTDDNIVNPLFKNVTITASAGKAMGEDALKFVGILKPETFAAHDDTKLFLYTNNNLYWWDGDANSHMNSFRAFFTVEGGAGTTPIKNLPARIVKEDKEAMGTESIQPSAVSSLKVLENGHVVIIRNGVKFTIQGQKIQ